MTITKENFNRLVNFSKKGTNCAIVYDVLANQPNIAFTLNEICDKVKDKLDLKNPKQSVQNTLKLLRDKSLIEAKSGFYALKS